MALLRSIATVSSWTMASRVLGLVRDILIARYLGAGSVADAFFVAFKFPNFFRRLFAEGAFNAAFVPQFGGVLEREGRAAARAFAEAALAIMIFVLLPAVILAQIAMPQIMVVLAPGFRTDPPTYQLAVELTRLTFPYLLFMALTALFGGVLNTMGRFAAAAAAPVFLNVILIAALIFLSMTLPTPGHALAVGVTVAGAVQLALVAIAAARNGMPIYLRRPRLTPETRTMLRLMLPGAVGAGAVQINLVIDVMLASLLPAGSISYLYYADRLAQFPLGVVGVATGIALLPLMSRQLGRGDEMAAGESQNRAVELGLLLTLPAAAALIAIPGPIIALLFERGSFDAASTGATTHALIAFSLGLPAYVLIKALAPGFFARGDTATPVKIAIAAMVINVVAAVALMQIFAHAGIALATAISAWVNAVLLFSFLVRKGYFRPDPRLISRTPRIIVAAVVMAVAIHYAETLFGVLYMIEFWFKAGAMAGLIIGGMVVYGVLILAMGAANLTEIRAALRR